MAHIPKSHDLKRPFGLESLFPGATLFEDATRDGYPDRLNFFIGIETGLSEACLWAEILNLTARLAGEVTALDFPIVRRLSALPPRGPCLLIHAPSPRHGLEVDIRNLGSNRVALAGSSAPGMAAIIRSLAVSRAAAARTPPIWKTMRFAGARFSAVDVLDRGGNMIGRLQLPPRVGRSSGQRPAVFFGGILDLAEAFYEVSAAEPRRRRLRLSMELDPHRLSPQVGLALCEILSRAVLEATELELPLAFAGTGRAGDVILRVRENSARRAVVELAAPPAGGVAILAEGGSRPLAECLRRWALMGFETGGPEGVLGDRLRARVQTVADLITGRGRWGAWAHQLVAAVSGGSRPAAVGNQDRPHLEKACRELGIRPPPPWTAAPIKLRESWKPETQRVMEAVRRIPPGSGRLEGIILVSKPEKRRRALKRSLSKILLAKGYRPRLAVLNAYKAGLSWLLEEVTPRLKKLDALSRVELSFRPFPAAPGGLELKSRFLQEIFPGPDAMAAALGLPLPKIRLSLCPDLQDVYRVRAWDRNRRLVFEQGFTPRWTRMPYLAGRPHLGSVHPACGGVRLSQKGRVIWDESIPTDREFFWRIFQERWLPAIEDFMAARLVSGEAPAVFWEDMKIEVAIDETDLRLGLGEERVAPMEALHEDLYFVLLDFFRIFSQEKRLADAQFGRIFPRVLPGARKGIPSAKLYARPLPPRPPAETRAVRRRVSVHSFRLAAGGIEIGLTALGKRADPAETDLLCRIARSWGHHLQSALDGKTFCLKYRPPRSPLPHQTSPTCTGAPPLRRLIPLSDVEAWVRRLGELPHLNAWCAGVTCQGRPVWALEAVLAGAGRPAVARMRLLKPTLLLNARHHANEVSSTNAALRLMWELGATGWGRRVLKCVNVAAVPLENADGVATLEALMPEAGGHKLHAARYNALGVEWYADYFAAEPRFPEARVKAELWRRWLPRVVLDAHGVPSHEWDQPFSGYAPYRFRQHWIPRSLIYVIVPFIDQPEHGGYRAARSIVEAMARAIGSDRDLRRLGAEFEDRYRRYARAWEPGIFPPADDRGLVAVPPENRIAGLNFAEQRFPVTVSEIVTEVTDEVVSGRLLEHCARAHMTAAKALMEWLGQASVGKLRRLPLPGGGLRLSWEPGIGAR